jgi:hypothetical protein
MALACNCEQHIGLYSIQRFICEKSIRHVRRALCQTSCNRNCSGTAPTIEHKCTATVLKGLYYIYVFNLYHKGNERVWVIKIPKSMLYREITAICCEIQKKTQKCTVQVKTEFLYVRPGGTKSNHCASEDYPTSPSF